MIYIACPEKFATGGTELLHQLCYKLKSFEIEAKIYYYNKTTDNPIADRFLKYNVEWTEEIVDSSDNILIVPEINVELLNKYKNINKYIWWLSVDNYKKKYKEYFKFNLNNLDDFQQKLKFYIKTLIKGINENKNIFINKNIKHLVQSKYAEEFLKLKGVNIKKIKYLSDYINDDFYIENLENSKRENNILFNPRKGLKRTRKIMKLFPEFNYIPIQNMTPQEIKELCLKSKVYIDFGNHPGKDRFPRETASLGCIVLTNKRGSAKYFEDVSIPIRYKYDETDEEFKRLGRNIEEIFKDYEKIFGEYNIYREKIKKEEQNFEEEILNIFRNKI